MIGRERRNGWYQPLLDWAVVTLGAFAQRWVSDTTEFVIGESVRLYLAAILDLYPRFVVGWALSALNDRRLTLKALEMAVHRRCPEPGLLHHSNRGCNLHLRGLPTVSRGARHHVQHESSGRLLRQCGVMESFFATVKKEEVERFPSYNDAKMALCDYIEVFYNHRWRHSTLGQIRPAAFERCATA